MNSFHLYLYGPQQGPIDTSFESASSRLEMLELLHFEPDGSFVWIRGAGEQQIYGMLYDAANQIQYSELQGKCHYDTWQQLLFAIRGGPPDDLVVMSLPERQLQDLQSFEKACWSETERK